MDIRPREEPALTNHGDSFNITAPDVETLIRGIESGDFAPHPSTRTWQLDEVTALLVLNRMVTGKLVPPTIVISPLRVRVLQGVQFVYLIAGAFLRPDNRGGRITMLPSWLEQLHLVGHEDGVDEPRIVVGDEGNPAAISLVELYEDGPKLADYAARIGARVDPRRLGETDGPAESTLKNARRYGRTLDHQKICLIELPETGYGDSAQAISDAERFQF